MQARWTFTKQDKHQSRMRAVQLPLGDPPGLWPRPGIQHKGVRHHVQCARLFQARRPRPLQEGGHAAGGGGVCIGPRQCL